MSRVLSGAEQPREVSAGPPKDVSMPRSLRMRPDCGKAFADVTERRVSTGDRSRSTRL